MKKFFSDPRIQKCFLPISFVCILPLWFMLIRKTEHIPAAAYILAAAAFVLFCLDRILKPWDRERAEKMRKPKAEDTVKGNEDAISGKAVADKEVLVSDGAAAADEDTTARAGKDERNI